MHLKLPKRAEKLLKTRVSACTIDALHLFSIASLSNRPAFPGSTKKNLFEQPASPGSTNINLFESASANSWLNKKNLFEQPAFPGSTNINLFEQPAFPGSNIKKIQRPDRYPTLFLQQFILPLFYRKSGLSGFIQKIQCIFPYGLKNEL